MNDDLRYPVGPFKPMGALSDAEREKAIDHIAAAPKGLRHAVEGLSDAQLDTPYRPGGWTVRQVTHHVADSHLNAYVRIKLALTEDEPTICAYDQEQWAKQPDSELPIDVSLRLLESLHERWVALMRPQAPAAWKRTLAHPEMGVLTLDFMLQLYAWHGRHHTAHVTRLKEREGW